MSKRFLLISFSLFLILLIIFPLFSMFFKSIYHGGHITLRAYLDLFSKNGFLLFKNSLLLSLLVSVLTLIFGVPLGILFGKTDLPFKRFFLFSFTLPLLIPPYIFAISWFYFIKRGGILSYFLPQNFINTLNNLFFGFSGSVFILFTIFLPIPILLTFSFLKTIDPQLEEAGRVFMNMGGVLKNITLPLIKPAIFLSFFLVFILSFGELSVPLFLRYKVYPLECFTEFTAFYNFSGATASSVPLAVFTLIFLLIMEGTFLKGINYQFKTVLNDKNFLYIKLKRSKIFLLTGVLFFLFFFVILPILLLIFESKGIKNYVDAILVAWNSILRNIFYAFIGATILTIFGFFISYVIKKREIRWWRFLDWLTIFSFALPGTVIGIGFISFFNNKYTAFIYSSFLIIILGYLVKYIALTSRITYSNLIQIPDSMEEVGAVSGISWFKRIIYIVLPLLRRGLLSAWIVAYIFCLRDTDITMILYPPGKETLPVKIFTLMANGRPELIASLCVLMIIITFLLPFLFWLLSNFLRWRKFNEGN